MIICAMLDPTLVCDVCGQTFDAVGQAMVFWRTEQNEAVQVMRVAHKGACDDHTLEKSEELYAIDSEWVLACSSLYRWQPSQLERLKRLAEAIAQTFPNMKAAARYRLVAGKGVYRLSFGSARPAVSPPAILVQAIVDRFGEVAEGELVVLVEPAWRALLRLLEDDPGARFKIPARKLEEIVAASYDADGYDEVILTPRSKDGGRDVIATKSGFHSVRIYDQAKAYAANRVVTANDVRAMLGVLHGNVSKGVITTTAKFAPELEDDANLRQFIPHRLELYDGERWIQRLGRLRDK